MSSQNNSPSRINFTSSISYSYLIAVYYCDVKSINVI